MGHSKFEAADGKKMFARSRIGLRMWTTPDTTRRLRKESSRHPGAFNPDGSRHAGCTPATESAMPGGGFAINPKTGEKVMVFGQ